MPVKLHRINIRIDDATYKELKAIGEQNGLTMAAIMRLTVMNWLSNREPGEEVIVSSPASIPPVTAGPAEPVGPPGATGPGDC